MASAACTFRFVRCPKCNKVLMEFANVPVYKCRACGAMLRAKYSKVYGNQPTNAQENDLLNNGPVLSQEQMIHHSLDVNDVVEEAKSPTSVISNLHNGIDCNEKITSTESRETRVEHKSSDVNSNQQTDQFAFIAPNQLDDSIQSNVDGCVNGKLEKSPTLSPESNGNSESKKKIEEISDGPVSSEGNRVVQAFDHEHGYTANKHGYTANDVSDSSSSGSPIKYVSRRTFRNKTVSVSSNCKEKKAAGGVVNCMMSSATETKRYYTISPLKSSIERSTSVVNASCAPNKDGISSRHGAHPRVQGALLDSQDFHSISKDSSFQGTSKKSLDVGPSTAFRYLECDHTELIKKVDEIRDTVNALFDRTVEGKRGQYLEDNQQEASQRSSFKFKSRRLHNHNLNPDLAQIQLSQEPSPHACGLPLHHHHMSCGACPSKICCHRSENANLHVNMDCGLPPCCHNLRREENGFAKSNLKDKRQSVKSHCLPVLGGAPFVICSNCFNLLHLPPDFLVWRKRLHKLRCGACSKVLVFSFHARTSGVNQTPAEVQHPPTEASVSNSDGCAQVDPVSFSEDFGPSLDKSYSIEVHNEAGHGRNDGHSSLHQLMGYDSARELLYATTSEDYEST